MSNSSSDCCAASLAWAMAAATCAASLSMGSSGDVGGATMGPSAASVTYSMRMRSSVSMGRSVGATMVREPCGSPSGRWKPRLPLTGILPALAGGATFAERLVDLRPSDIKRASRERCEGSLERYCTEAAAQVTERNPESFVLWCGLPSLHHKRFIPGEGLDDRMQGAEAERTRVLFGGPCMNVLGLVQLCESAGPMGGYREFLELVRGSGCGRARSARERICGSLWEQRCARGSVRRMAWRPGLRFAR